MRPRRPRPTDDIPPERHFGKWLRREIENRLLTQRQFASKAGINHISLNKVLSQASPPLTGLTIVRIARALELPRETVEDQLYGRLPAA